MLLAQSVTEYIQTARQVLGMLLVHDNYQIPKSFVSMDQGSSQWPICI